MDEARTTSSSTPEEVHEYVKKLSSVIDRYGHYLDVVDPDNAGQAVVIYLDANETLDTLEMISLVNVNGVYQRGAYIAQAVDGHLTLYRDGIQTARSQSVVTIASLLSKLEDTRALYDVAIDAIHTFLNNSGSKASDFKAVIETKYAGLRGEALTLYQNIVAAMATTDCGAFIASLKSILKPNTVIQDQEGNVIFPETSATRNDSFGILIDTVVNNFPALLTSVISALSIPFGIAGAAIGGVLNGLSSLVNFAYNAGTEVKVNNDSENYEMACRVCQHEIQHHQGTLTIWNQLHSFFDDSKAPVKIGMPGVEGYAWFKDPADPESSIVLELYPSCRYWIDDHILADFFNQHFYYTRTIYVDYYDCFVGPRAAVEDPTLQDFADLFYDNAVAVPKSWWSSASAAEKTDMVVKCYVTTCMCIFLLQVIYQLQCEGAGTRVHVAKQSGTGQTVYDWSNMNYQAGGMVFLCNVYGNQSQKDLMSIAPRSGERGVYEAEWSGLMSCNENYMSFPGGLAVPVLRAYHDNVTHIDPTTGDIFTLCCERSICNVRYPFLVTPAAWTRSAISAALVCTIVIICGAAAVVATAAVKLTQFRALKRAQYGARTEKAWEDFKENPTAENFKSYKKACFKQNWIGSIFGCSKVNTTNFWGDVGTADSESGSSGISTTLANLNQIQKQTASMNEMTDDRIGYLLNRVG